MSLKGDPDFQNGFVARFDAQGTAQWGQAIVGSKSSTSSNGDVNLTCLALNGAGTHMLAGGFFTGTTTFAPSKVLNSIGNNSSSFIADYSAQGALRGVRQESGATAGIQLRCMTADPTGGVQPFVAGAMFSNQQTVATTTTVAGVTLPIRAFYVEGFVARIPAVVLATRQANPAYRFTAYPVPSKDGYLHLALPSAALPEATLTISNVLGQQLRSHVVPANTASTTISTAGLAPGHYVVRLATGTEGSAQLIEVE